MSGKKQAKRPPGKPKTWCRVYILRDPDTRAIRYVGQTRQKPQKRMGWHKKNIRKRKNQAARLSPALSWIDGILGSGREPALEVIDDDAVWDISEAVWIDRLTIAGHDLLNITSRVPFKNIE